jgi:hypothetical protein
MFLIDVAWVQRRHESHMGKEKEVGKIAAAEIL